MLSEHYKIIRMEVHHLSEGALLFDQYRQFYGQKSDVQGAHHFLSERMRNKESVIYLARDSKAQKAIGFMQLYQSFSSISMERLWILNDLYVLPEAREQGVGKALIQTAKSWVKELNDKGLALSTAIDNSKAQKLYQQLGFDQDKKFLHYFWKRTK